MPESIGLVTTGSSRGTQVDAGANDSKGAWQTIGSATTDFVGLTLSISSPEVQNEAFLFDVRAGTTLSGFDTLAENIYYTHGRGGANNSVLEYPIWRGGQASDSIQVRGQTANGSDRFCEFSANLVNDNDVPFNSSSFAESLAALTSTTQGKLFDPGGTSNTEVKTLLTTTSGVSNACNFLSLSMGITDNSHAAGKFVVKLYKGSTGGTDTGASWQNTSQQTADYVGNRAGGRWIGATTVGTKLWLGVQYTGTDAGDRALRATANTYNCTEEGSGGGGGPGASIEGLHTLDNGSLV